MRKSFRMREIKKQKKWSVQYQAQNTEANASVAQLARELQITETTAKLLYTRGFHTASAATSFLNQAETNLHDPFSLLDITAAVERIFLALDNKERIVI